jgi:hypothetical protein
VTLVYRLTRLTLPFPLFRINTLRMVLCIRSQKQETYRQVIAFKQLRLPASLRTATALHRGLDCAHLRKYATVDSGVIKNREGNITVVTRVSRNGSKSVTVRFAAGFSVEDRRTT